MSDTQKQATPANALPISDQIRQAIRESGLSKAAVVRAVGWNRTLLNRFLSGKGGCYSAVIDKLGTVLGLSVVVNRTGVDGAKQRQ